MRERERIRIRVMAKEQISLGRREIVEVLQDEAAHAQRHGAPRVW